MKYNNYQTNLTTGNKEKKYMIVLGSLFGDEGKGCNPSYRNELP